MSRKVSLCSCPWLQGQQCHHVAPPSVGGIVLNPSFYGTFGHTHTMIHEIGHSLGLYHVFRGVSEVESCNDACLETEASLETGDLCADTNPTPKYKHCWDPEPGNDTCGRRHFSHTPFHNYMSYTGERAWPHGKRTRITFDLGAPCSILSQEACISQK